MQIKCFRCLLLIPLLSIIVTTRLACQNYLPLEDYFQEKIPAFEDQLVASGLAEYFSVKKLYVYEDHVQMHMSVAYSAPDSAATFWRSIQEDFREENPIELGQWLFLKMAHTFDIPYEDAILRISSGNLPGQLPAVDGRFRFDPGRRLIIKEGFVFRSEVKDTLNLPNFRISAQFTLLPDTSYSDVEIEQRKFQIYHRILERAESYYSNRPGSVEFRHGVEDPLTFEVKNIKEEVVAAKWLNPHEKLFFTISVEQKRDQLLIACSIDGKYGSGIYFLKPSVLENYSEMFPKYEKELRSYIDLTFKPLLLKWLAE